MSWVRSVIAVLVFVTTLPPAPAEQSAGVFRVWNGTDTPAQGSLLRIEADGTVHLGGARPSRTPGAAFVSLRRRVVPLPAFPLSQHVICATGDRVTGVVLGVDGDNLLVRPAFAPTEKLTIPLSVVTLVWLTPPDLPERPDRLLRRLHAEPRTKDVVLLSNGDVIAGTLTGLDDKKVRIEADDKSVKEANRAAVAVIALNTELLRAPKPAGVANRLVLAKGDRLVLTGVEATDTTLSGTTLFGEKVKLPVADLIALDLVGGRVTELADLTPVRTQHVPYFGVNFPVVRDGSGAGRDLRLAGSTCDRVVGVHPSTRISYQLDGTYRRFEALVGLDDQSGRGGSVRVAVEIDGKPAALGWDHELTHNAGPRQIRLDVTAARELTLVVDLGRGPDVQSHVNFVDARLLK